MSYGPEAIHDLISESGMSYPVTPRQIEREHALSNVEIDERGNSIMVAEILSRTDADSFDSRDDLVETLEPVFEREREERRPGIVGRVARLFLGRR